GIRDGHVTGVQTCALPICNRSPLLPNLASAHEQGLTDFDSYFWSGFLLPKEAPAGVVRKLHDAAVATLDTPAVEERLKVVGVTRSEERRVGKECRARSSAT